MTDKQIRDAITEKISAPFLQTLYNCHIDLRDEEMATKYDRYFKWFKMPRTASREEQRIKFFTQLVKTNIEYDIAYQKFISDFASKHIDFYDNSLRQPSKEENKDDKIEGKINDIMNLWS